MGDYKEEFLPGENLIGYLRRKGKLDDGSGHHFCELCGLCKECGDCEQFGCGEKSNKVK